MNGPANDRVELRLGDLDKLSKRGYTLGSLIGKGSYATVYLADFQASGSTNYQLLACRVFDKERAPGDFLQNFFCKEIDILTKIHNPHLVQVHSIVSIGPRVFIFMRYEQNGDLLQFLQWKGPVGAQQARRWFWQMLSGLHYLHSNEIAHRDLKCENILISKSGNVKLADFGFATFCVDLDGIPLLSTTFCGSTCYAAPEILSGTPHDPKPADVWSLGVVLYTMLTSSMPFDDTKSLANVVKEQVSRGWKSQLEEGRLVVSRGARAVLDGVLEPDTVCRLTVTEVLAHDWLQLQRGPSPQNQPPAHHPVLKRRSESFPALRSLLTTL